ncbi:uncharacterized protein CCOS01_15568 [Colletotrichum costaricense]|uniref:Uncharacterized protein n=1 Tax=Colletotrichum costaricense TaxID=1209916 RepID=A0AAI9YHA9_9PEZI|nr:uncharacterized protein CCOS01_15568 [Colletotrichum costaricense]KAK1509474.1 hypothetical protein CCOS01_15568 [Colletotrichum costaricense]
MRYLGGRCVVGVNWQAMDVMKVPLGLGSASCSPLPVSFGRPYRRLRFEAQRQLHLRGPSPTRPI